ncbi:GTP-binding protein ypt5 [Smittium mucronatum]|uniref:GTP-binding protein ypt5 n=1 Tax=Smittium mucronatum TaxID=133383 RepID=A0A1R0H329_9FUNG|nr:GTP-binding protein ypt5 [Smittium mucronatum]
MSLANAPSSTSERAQSRPRPKQFQFKLVLLAAFLTKVVTLENGDSVKFEIWDTAGQERYKSLAPMYYRNANCAVVVYDITQTASFDRAQSWIEELKKQADSNIIIALAGNKTDLNDQRTVSTSEGQSFAEQNNLLFFETSAKESTSIIDLFSKLAQKLVDAKSALPEHVDPSVGQGRSTVNLNSANDVQSQDACSC